MLHDSPALLAEAAPPLAAPLIRTLLLRFAEPLPAAALPAFRGAVAAAVGPEAVLFHQHEPDGGLRYQYPLVQYRLLGGTPALYCLHDGVEAAQVFLQRPHWDLELGGRPLPLTLADVRVRQHYPRVLPGPELAMRYRLRQWLPFNQANYALWLAADSLVTRYALLEKLLVGHILAFASGVGWHVPAPIRVALTQVRAAPGGRVKGQSRLAFEVEFGSNVVLPEAIGLGRHVSLGFGVVQAVRPPVPGPGPRGARRPAAVPFAFADPAAAQ